jgi:hypothetical protein
MAVRLAEQVEEAAAENQDLLGHVGYYLLGAVGRCWRDLKFYPSVAVRFGRWLLNHPTGVYLGLIFLLLGAFEGLT